MAHVRTLGEVIEAVSRTGQAQTLTQEEWQHFRAEFSAAVGPKIDRIRAEQRQAFAACRNLVLD